MKRRTVLGVAAVLAGVIVCVALAPLRPGIVIVIRNESGVTVTHVVVETRGLEFPVGDIPDGEEREVGITACGGSGATLLYSAMRTTNTAEVVGYFEGDPDGVTAYGGVVTYTIGESTWTTEGEVSLALPFLPTRRPLPAGRPRAK